MRSYGDTAHTPVGPTSPPVETIPALEKPIRRCRVRVTQVNQINLSPRVWETQQAGQMLAQTLEVRETKIVALRRDVENGHYDVKAEQVAEKIMKDHLLELFD